MNFQEEIDNALNLNNTPENTTPDNTIPDNTIPDNTILDNTIPENPTPSNVPSRVPSRVEWNDGQIRALINIRRNRNYEYHYQIPGRSRVRFWREVADSINDEFDSNFTGKQAQTKFNGLVSDYHVSKILIK
jgi:hypothetical protein